jgi:hypothetical protein
MKTKIKKPVKYTAGPRLKRGTRLPGDFLPVDQIRLRAPDITVPVSINPDNYKVLARQAKSLKIPVDKIMGSIFDVYVQGLRQT